MNLSRVKLFTGNAYFLEASLNEYLQSLTAKEHVIDIKYSSSVGVNKDVTYSALVLLEVDI